MTVGHAVGVPVAFRGDVHGTGGCGARQRLFPAVVPAYGMPRKAHDGPRSAPCTAPSSTTTKHVLCAAVHSIDTTDPDTSTAAAMTKRVRPAIVPVHQVMVSSGFERLQEYPTPTQRVLVESPYKAPKSPAQCPMPQSTFHFGRCSLDLAEH